MQLSIKAKFYKNFLGQIIVLEKSGWRLFKGNKNSLRRVKIIGQASSHSNGVLTDYEASFYDPRAWLKKRGRVILGDKFLTLQKTLFGKYHEIERFVAEEILELPKTRRPEYLFETKTGDLIYVDSPEFPNNEDDWGYYENFRLFFIKENQATLIPQTEDVTRYRDGGTTYIFTQQGSLFSPASGNGKHPLWDDKRLIRLDGRSAKKIKRKFNL